MSASPPICDYEGSDYRSRFWEGQGRRYEDVVERIALRRLMPAKGDTLIDMGAGYGRLADEYTGYQRVVLFDFSRSLLREAQANLGDDPRFIYVAGNWYHLPFVDGLFDTIVQVRTLHHAADVPALLSQLARVARPSGNYILEFANKHNLKAILRYALRRQAWSPFSLEPVEFVHLNFDFHPRWIRQQLQDASFTASRTLTVSHFRIGPLKKWVPTKLLVALDAMTQFSGAMIQLSPSVFVRSAKPATGKLAEPGAFFACPHCQSPLEAEVNGYLPCANPTCGQRWSIKDGLYDFKEPLHRP